MALWLPPLPVRTSSRHIVSSTSPSPLCPLSPAKSVRFSSYGYSVCEFSAAPRRERQAYNTHDDVTSAALSRDTLAAVDLAPSASFQLAPVGGAVSLRLPPGRRGDHLRLASSQLGGVSPCGSGHAVATAVHRNGSQTPVMLVASLARKAKHFEFHEVRPS